MDTNVPLLEGYLSKDELAANLGKGIRTLDRLERQKQGPPRIKIGRLILYRVDSVRNWLVSREQKSRRKSEKPLRSK
jgi:predicted DNA-binding transcriptional regulator AlpA